MLHADKKYKIEEKEVDGILKFQVQLGEDLRTFDSLLDAKLAIKTFKLGTEFQKITGMERFMAKL